MNSNNYIICSAGGFKEECEVYRKNAEESFTAIIVLSALSGAFLSLFNLFHLLYILNLSKLMKGIQKQMITCCK